MPTTITSAGITFNDATSLTSANIGTAQLVNGSVTAAKLGTTEQKQIAKAWVNFNGTTSPGTIRSSYNVSSVTKNSTGLYTINFSTPMTDANYAISISGYQTNVGNTFIGFATGDVYTTSQVRITTYNGLFASNDMLGVSIVIFGN